MEFDWSVIWPALPILIEGAKMTLLISILGLIGGRLSASWPVSPAPTAAGSPTTSR